MCGWVRYLVDVWDGIDVELCGTSAVALYGSVVKMVKKEGEGLGRRNTAW